MSKLLSILLMIFALPASAEIYKWVDEQGKVHYGDKPQSDASELKVDIEKKGHIKTSAEREEKRRRLIEEYKDDDRREAETREKEKQQKKALAKDCVYAKDKLRRYQKASQLYELDKNGNRVAVSEEKKTRELQKLQKSINRHCQ